MKFPKFKLPKRKPSFRQTGMGAYSWRNLSLRSKIYAFAIFVTIFFMLIMPTAYASVIDIFGFGTHDLYESITKNVVQTNEILNNAFDFAMTSPYTVVNSLAGETQGIRLANIRNAIISIALVVATLLLMVEFFRKTINFEWSSKWENILIFLIKIIVIKQIVQNADVIVGYIYAGFNYANVAATGGTMEFLPAGNVQTYVIPRGWWSQTVTTVSDFFTYIFTNTLNPPTDPFRYVISQDAVRMFYPSAVFPSGTLMLNENPFPDPTTGAAYNATLELVLLQPYFWILKGVALAIYVIAVGRVLELSVYTIFAPLPLATFASDVTNDVGRNFLKNYIAVVLQIVVIVVMFMVYVALNRTMSDGILVKIVVLISLGLGVIKSGAWARKICGTG